MKKLAITLRHLKLVSRDLALNPKPYIVVSIFFSIIIITPI